MSTAIQTEKMIYEKESTAKMLLAKLAKRYTDRKYHIVSVTGGWQIVQVQVIPAFMPAPLPKPVKKARAMKIEEIVAGSDDLFVLTLDYARETAAWLFFKNATLPWIKKSHLVGSQLDPATKKITIRMSHAKAAQLGLTKLALAA
jgi:hypothetical protein